MLTIGFARRVPTYKRLTLMLRDPERLKRLLLDPERPVQLVIAGKAHPADETGKQLIQQMVQFADDPEVRHRIVFLPNYDIAMAQYLYPGCDVWLNNPLRPFEACGTSGMKAALNGGLNLSILDGWWDEWYDGENGWAIPTADGVEDPDRRDDLEAAALYDLIENQVAPRFYDRDDDGLPQRWLAMMTHTLTTLGPKVLASPHGARLHVELYGPAARAGWALNGPEYAGAKSLAAFKAKVRGAWSGVRVDHVESSGVSDSPQVGDRLHVRAFVSLGELSPDDVEVQVVHGRTLRVRRPARRRDRAADVRRVLRGRPAPVRGRPRAVAARGRSATPCGCCRTTAAWPARPSWAWSPTPDPRDRTRTLPPFHGGRVLLVRRRTARSPCRGAAAARPGQRRAAYTRSEAAVIRVVVPGRSGAAPGRAARRRCPRAARTPRPSRGPAASPSRPRRRRAGRGTARRPPPRRRRGASARVRVCGSSQRPLCHRLAVGGEPLPGRRRRPRGRAGR